MRRLLVAALIALGAAAPARAWRPFGEPSDGKIRPVQKLSDQGKAEEVLSALTPQFLQTLRGTDLRQAYVLLGDTLDRLHRPDEALGDYQVGVSLFPKNVDLLTRQAGLLHRNGLDEQARPLFEAALQYEPRHWGAHLGLAEIDRRLGFLDRAADHYEIALETLDKRADLWRDYAEVLLAMRDQATADLALRKALSLEPRSADAHVLLAFSERQAKRMDEAVQQLDEALGLGAGVGARRAKALFLLEAGKTEEARAEAEKVLAAEPGDGAALWTLARAPGRRRRRGRGEDPRQGEGRGRPQRVRGLGRARPRRQDPRAPVPEMKVPFWKMSGAGNDFVLLDGLPRGRSAAALARRLCDRRHGIGADGLLVMTRRGRSPRADYRNSDGSAAFCGNGSRCAALWAAKKGWASGRRFVLETGRGPLSVRLTGRGRAEIGMPEPANLRLGLRLKAAGRRLRAHFVDAGVPHAVVFVPDVERVDVKTLGRALRFHRAFGRAGANADFVDVRGGTLRLRTYERGVEDETLACGTGVVAAAAVARALGRTRGRVRVRVRGGDLLTVAFDDGVRLEGPGAITFSGEVDL